MQSNGWKNLAKHGTVLGSAAELALDDPHSGRTALHLQCWPLQPDQGPVALESAPIVITSAAVPVRRGQLVRIHGWARVADTVAQSGGALLLYDSLLGPELALHFDHAPQWREFSLYRAAPADGVVTVSAALQATGEAWLDDVTIHTLDAAPAQAQGPSSRR